MAPDGVAHDRIPSRRKLTQVLKLYALLMEGQFDAIFPAFLDPVHRPVGMADEIFTAVSMLGIARNSDRRRQPDRETDRLEEDVSFERFSDLLGDDGGTFDPRLGQDHRELVPSVTGDDVGLADHAPNDAADLASVGSLEVDMSVVDRLEPSRSRNSSETAYPYRLERLTSC